MYATSKRHILATWAHIDEQTSAKNSNKVEWLHKLYITMVLFKCVCYFFLENNFFHTIYFYCDFLSLIYF